MTQNIALHSEKSNISTSTALQRPLVSVVEVPTVKGQCVVPAVKEISLALSLSNFSFKWQGLRGLRSEVVSKGTIALCQVDKERVFEYCGNASFAVVLLRNEALVQVHEDGLFPRAGLQVHDVLHDSTLQSLLEVLVHEKRSNFSSGSFFLDSVATALAGYLVRHYSSELPAKVNSRGGLAPYALRRCIEFINAHLETNLRLSDLAREAGLSASHFVRSFRASTGKTPHQFLLHRRIEHARDLMRDRRLSLTEVALASGFADQHHLARVFRRSTGTTPGTYRRSLQ